MMPWVSMIMNTKVDPVLDSIFNAGLSSGIDIIYSESEFYITIRFQNGTKITSWNRNRYYAWLCKGVISTMNGGKYKWEDGRPKRRTMYRLYKALEGLKS